MVTMDAPVTELLPLFCFLKETLWQRVLRLFSSLWKMWRSVQAELFHPDLQIFQEKDEASFVAWNGLECVECGSCSYVCPAKRQLKQAIGSMRKTALANRKK